MLNRRIILIYLLIFGFCLVHSQEIITAGRYLDMVSETYAAIRDYEANIAIRSGGSDMTGSISHLTPSFLRIDFTRPADQVMVFNGEQLTIYLPEYRAVLNQNINKSRRTITTGPGMASAQGLTMLKRNYAASFVTGPNPEPLDAGSRERVVKLRLTRSSSSEPFREIILNVNPETMFIRRIEGKTITESEVRFDFTNVRVNQGIPEQRFIYDSPASANMYNNFLFRDAD